MPVLFRNCLDWESSKGDAMQSAKNEDPRPAPNPDPNPSVAGAAPLEKLPFELQKGEKIIRELKPQFIGFMVSREFGGYLGILAIILLIISLSVILFSGVLAGVLSVILVREINRGLLIGISILPITIFVLISIRPLLAYGKSWYWITNIRVIGKRGVLGYSINSIPLDSISDVVLSRTLLDRFLGLSSLAIVPLGGTGMTMADVEGEAKFLNTNFFPALPQTTARELQRVLFNLREELRKSQMEGSNSSAPTSPEAAQPRSDSPRGV